MTKELLAIDISEPLEGKEEETIAVLGEFYELLQRKGYCRDELYRDAQDRKVMLDLRWWSSEEAARQAHEDPDVHRFWKKLGNLIRMRKVYERLDKV